jgi:hypothetical protein
MMNRNTNDAGSDIPGWALVDAAFTYARKRNLVEDELLRFFDLTFKTLADLLATRRAQA